MYYNKRDSKGRFTKTCKMGCSCGKKKIETPHMGNYTEKLIDDCEVICRNATTEQLKDIFNTVVKGMKSLQVPKEDLDNITPFLTAMHTFYELALKGSLFAKELDKRIVETKTMKELAKKNINKGTDKEAFEEKAFNSIKE